MYDYIHKEPVSPHHSLFILSFSIMALLHFVLHMLSLLLDFVRHILSLMLDLVLHILSLIRTQSDPYWMLVRDLSQNFWAFLFCYQLWLHLRIAALVGNMFMTDDLIILLIILGINFLLVLGYIWSGFVMIQLEGNCVAMHSSSQCKNSLQGNFAFPVKEKKTTPTP